MYSLKYLNINKISLKHMNFWVLGFGFGFGSGEFFEGVFGFGFGFEPRPEPKFKTIYKCWFTNKSGIQTRI